jgi:hypothetical protein
MGCDRPLSGWLLAAIVWAGLSALEASVGVEAELVEIRPESGQLVIRANGENHPIILEGVHWGASVAPADPLFASAVAVHTKSLLEERLGSPFPVIWSPQTGTAPAPAQISLSSGEDLAAVLVTEGLARVAEGTAGDRWAGKEREASFKGRGLWTSEGARKSYIVFHLPSARQDLAGDALRATDTTNLVAQQGRLTKVRGEISRVGASPSGHLTFLNFRGVDRGGFSVIVRRDNVATLAAALDNFPDGLVGQTVEISGPIALHRDAPQIELRTPEQLVLIK